MTSSRKTAVVFTVDLDELDALERHNADIGRAIYAMAQVACDNRNAGKSETTEINPKGFRDTYEMVLRKAFREQDLAIAYAVGDALEAVHVYPYEMGTFNTTKTTAELPPNHAMFIVNYDYGLSELSMRQNVGIELKRALDLAVAHDDDGIVDLFLHPKDSSRLKHAFVVGDHHHDGQFERAFSVLSGPVVMNLGARPRHVLIEGGCMTTFGYNGYDDRPGVTPQLS